MMRKHGISLRAEILGLLDDSFTTRYAFKPAVKSMARRADEQVKELAVYELALSVSARLVAFLSKGGRSAEFYEQEALTIAREEIKSK